MPTQVLNDNEKTAREKRALALSCSAHFLTHMNMLIFPAVVAPISRETGFDIAEIFPVGFVMYLLYGAMALPAGYFADHWSKVAILRICMAGIGVSSIAAGLAGGAGAVTVALSFIGLFCGLYHPAGLGLIAAEITRQGKAHGTNGIFGAMGIAAAPFLAGAILFAADWRAVFIVSGVMSLAGAAASFIWPVIETHRGAPRASRAEGSNNRDRLYSFCLLLVIMTIGGLTYRANMTALPVFFEGRAASLIAWMEQAAPSGSANASSGAAAFLVGAVFLFSMAGQYMGGVAADRMDIRRAYFLFIISGAPLAALMSVFHEAALVAAAAGFAFFNLGVQPIENSLVSRLTPRRWLSTGYGIKFTFTFGLGSIAVYQVAMMEKWRGLGWLYPALAVQVIVMAALSAALIRISRNIKLPHAAAADKASG